MGLQIRRLSYSLGAEIIGIDIRQPIDEKSYAAIHTAFLEHGILLFRGQALTRAQHVAFGRLFGEVDNNEASPRYRDSEHPEIQLVTNKPRADGKPYRYAGEVWHTDQSHTCTPAMATLLRSVEIPDVGGDTMFANMYLAYETLSDGMKKLIGTLDGIHFGGRSRIDTSSPEREAETKRRYPPIAQPLVRVHPETGRKALYLGEKVKQLVGLTAEESLPLIQFLCLHAARPQFVYRHRWRKDDLIIWDNRCTTHIAVNDYDKTQIRHMERATVRGRHLVTLMMVLCNMTVPVYESAAGVIRNF